MKEYDRTHTSYGVRTGKRGVRFLQEEGVYRAQICTSVGNLVLGFYDTLQEASDVVEDFGQKYLPAFYTMPDLIGGAPKQPTRKVVKKKKAKAPREPYLGPAELTLLEVVKVMDGALEGDLRAVLSAPTFAAVAHNYRRTMASLVRKGAVRVANGSVYLEST